MKFRDWKGIEILGLPITCWQAWVPLLPVAMIIGALVGEALR